MKTKLFDKKWSPWFSTGNGFVGVFDQVWREPEEWSRLLNHPICDECNSAMISNGVCCVDRMPRNTETVFPSLCDWLGDDVPVECLWRFLRLIHGTPNLNWMMLTKHPERFVSRLRMVQKQIGFAPSDAVERIDAWISGTRVPSNVWVGTSIETQAMADERIPKLLEIPAAGRFLSVEPLLGEVDLHYSTFNGADAVSAMDGIHWVIVGGESGSGARPCNVDWIRSLVGQCRKAAVPVFVKQIGSEPVFNAPRRVEDWGQEHISEGAWISAMTQPNGEDPDEWYYDLRVREFPVALGGAR